MRSAPEEAPGTEGNAFDFTPVESAAAAISRLSALRASGVFHAAADRGVSLERWARALESHGAALDRIPWREWRRKAEAGGAETAGAVLPLSRWDPALLRRHRTFDLFQAGEASFDRRRADAVLARLGEEGLWPPEATQERVLRAARACAERSGLRLRPDAASDEVGGRHGH